MPDHNNSDIKVKDFCDAVAPIIDLLQKNYEPCDSATTPNGDKRPLYISDVVDNNGKRYVDLVQEGGGVHGIALAGYTYVLEKLGVAFMKMAGTSAGSINTMLLTAVTTKSELTILKKQIVDENLPSHLWEQSLRYDPRGLSEDNYYDTRSEKLLEYLCKKDLGDLVDGHSSWRNILLKTFSGNVTFDNIKSYFKKLGIRAILWAILLLIMFAAGIFLACLSCDDGVQPAFRWIYGGAALLSTLLFAYLLKQGVKGRLMYKFSERFGINPGKNFEQWIEKTLKENAINNVSQLKNKLQAENAALNPRIAPCGDDVNNMDGANRAQLLNELTVYIKDTDIHALLLAGAPREDMLHALEEINSLLIIKMKKIKPSDPAQQQAAKQLVRSFMAVNMLRYPPVEGTQVSDNEVTTPFEKEIALVSSDIINQIKVEFPAMHKMYWGKNYDISPAKYVRASMSIPLFFKPFRIDYDLAQKDVIEQEWCTLVNLDKHVGDDNTYTLMVDGGVLSNFPVNIFYSEEAPLPLKPTLGAKLEFEDDARSGKVESLKGFAGAIISTMRFFYDRDFMAKHNIFKKTVRSIDTGNISWLNFAMSDEEKTALFFRGALTAAMFLLGSEALETRKKYMEQLVQMGKAVHFKGKTFSIYGDGPCTFLTEDNKPDEVGFDWNLYKRDRMLVYGLQAEIKKQLKNSASYSSLPSNNADKNQGDK